MEWPLGKQAILMENDGSSKKALSNLVVLDASTFPQLPTDIDPANMDPARGLLVRNVRFESELLEKPVDDNNPSFNLGWLDFEAWTPALVAEVLIHYQCLQHVYAKEPAQRSATLDKMLSCTLRRVKQGDLYLGITELGLPKVMAVIEGMMIVIAAPLLSLADGLQATSVIDVCAGFQQGDVNDMIEAGGFVAVLKQGDVLAVPAGWMIAMDSPEALSTTLSSTCGTKHQLSSTATMDGYPKLIALSESTKPCKTQLQACVEVCMFKLEFVFFYKVFVCRLTGWRSFDETIGPTYLCTGLCVSISASFVFRVTETATCTSRSTSRSWNGHQAGAVGLYVFDVTTLIMSMF